jgi:hypothetical protein
LKYHSDFGIRVSSGADEPGISPSRAQDESMLLLEGDLWRESHDPAKLELQRLPNWTGFFHKISIIMPHPY